MFSQGAWIMGCGISPIIVVIVIGYREIHILAGMTGSHSAALLLPVLLPVHGVTAIYKFTQGERTTDY